MRRSAVGRANEIRLKRQEHKGSFLVVEGRDDRLFCEQFTSADACSVIVAEGKSNVIDTVGILEADSFSGVVGVVDADLDHIEGAHPTSDNLITLETVDLEALLIRSGALDRVLVELGSRAKIAKFNKDVRDTLLQAAMPIGCLRLYSLRAGLKLSFEGLRYANCIDKTSLAIDNDAMVREVMNRSQRHDLHSRDVVRKILAVQRLVNDQWVVCHGVDMVAILAHGLRSALGTNKANAVRVEAVRMCLRLGFRRADLHASKLAADLRNWSNRNAGFLVLRPDDVTR